MADFGEFPMTREAQVSFDIVDGDYGFGTAEIRRKVLQARAMRWQSLVEPPFEEIRTLLATLFDVLGDRWLLRDTELVEFVDGGWAALAEIYPRINSFEPAGDLNYPQGAWRQMLGRLASECQHQVSRSCPELVRPPLFPFQGNPSVISGRLVPSPASVEVDANPRLLKTIRHLVCDVDEDFWNAIIEALAGREQRGRGPFAVLTDIYEAGAYPLGLSNDRFIVYIQK